MGVFTRKRRYFVKLTGCIIICAFMLAGCGGKNNTQNDQRLPEAERAEAQKYLESEETKEQETAAEPETTQPVSGETVTEPEIVEADWSAYFDGFCGAAVVYDASAGRFTVYNRELAMTRRSPCSTFKIISSLIGLENGNIEPEDSLRKWSGEAFWSDAWNKDIDFKEAFRASCVWYFREITDEIGPERIQQELDRLGYGNCDISDWEGRLNTNNNNRALTGFWIESSLLISPKEQTQVLERIFGEASVYSEETKEALEEVMLVEIQEDADISIYGKTGMGKAAGIVVDAWFVGFARHAGQNIYFCVYLGRTDNKNVTSTAAKEIAVRLVSDYCSGL